MLALRRLVWTVFVSLSASSASAISKDENGPSNVAALGFRTLRDFAAPTYEGAFLCKLAAWATEAGFTGVAGAS
jgi:hypothetical protein